MSLFRYKGFYGSAEASVEDNCLFGKLEFIEPLISYEGQNVEELEQAFKEAVDDYLLDTDGGPGRGGGHGVKNLAGNLPNRAKAHLMCVLVRYCTGMRSS